ncbi:4-diphosphocytidyl-2C-methyl-D-erythritol kinase [Thermosipho melanesiensis]|uniref:4-diphosphocytidyl-2-C-methyl-D-erythritol kinase n=2 Tax=Thermosipho melanesiensis TaxID=46541 RepID=ISPE_THEM4|nr:4-(cytidine 5'-diphospho)-2-C-methyl-D-erythritol kinase [Thermosipho melanesiensis]A6LJT9.1 RecName: Full=4-diphosphocytidyl-2-C-methyl-D-erythritol kinase; Short=CMK; AltName: Full=4-(cytidine-5'-diphospho)-2-C-methyl-D-erythritol kinase [Thermosipho melanesiensis BI429]ABR30190.1 4-diphosphocytidyl-2C-methyl-D-erythritol kinase [Thermosipho melanesiensis BI429]APT73389.1 4-diphosphocytidyl-2C-methyl-D-erythritol kinase [Thermosipho melanesiensis]OOC38202.1 4-diphosphocytidyl-2C-methyl-D-e
MEQSSGAVIRSYAKINLFLDVTKKRDDGYHEILSLFQNISLYDRLIITKIDRGLEIKTNVDIENNILYKTWDVFSSNFKEPEFGLRIVLEKNIPMQAGLGGGSSNAAALLFYLSDQLKIPKNKIIKIAAKIGSDVPFFLIGGTAVVKGKGEIIEPLPPLLGYYVKLITANGISTKEAYNLLNSTLFNKAPCSPYALYEAYYHRNIDEIKRCTYNIFEKVIAKQNREIAQNIKKLKKNSIVSTLTGSGSAVYGISFREGDFNFVPRGVEYEEINI